MSYRIIRHRAVNDDRQWVEEGREVVASLDDARKRADRLLGEARTDYWRDRIRRDMDALTEDGGIVVGQRYAIDITRAAA